MDAVGIEWGKYYHLKEQEAPNCSAPQPVTYNPYWLYGFTILEYRIINQVLFCKNE